MTLPRPRKGRGLQRNTMDRVARIDVIEDGDCQPRICGLEAACKPLPNKQHKCICPHDSLPPTTDKKCPIRKTVSETPPPMYNIIPPTSNPLQLKHSNINNAQLGHISARPTTTFDGAAWPVLGACVLVLLVIVTSLCWWKKSHLLKFLGRSESRKASSCNGSPRYLNKSVLMAERYASNPQYSGTAVLPEPPPLPVPCSVPLIMRSALQLHQELGEGCFGKVYRGELLDVPDVEDDDVEAGAVHQVAIKVLKSSASREAEEDFMREVEIMSGFRHPNILTLLGIVQRDGKGEPWMVFEFMAHGDLAEVLRANSRQLWRPLPGLPSLNPSALHSVALQVAAGMRYLAAQHFVHRDLACRNCLVGAGLVVKIADFGMSRDVYTCDYYKIGGSRMLPVRWMSPESVMYGRFTLESDVWSYGVVLWEIFSLGRQPYYGHSNEEVVKLILQGIMLIPPEKCPPIICDLMRCCWKTDPRDRIKFPEIHERLLKAPPLPPLTSRPCSPPRIPQPPSVPIVTSLPLPPNTISCGSAVELLDADSYLLPIPKITPEYLETLPN